MPTPSDAARLDTSALAYAVMNWLTTASSPGVQDDPKPGARRPPTRATAQAGAPRRVGQGGARVRAGPARDSRAGGVNRPSRATAGGRLYLDLQAWAHREGRPTDELLLLYVLERFLYRLSRSEHRDRLVLKGGMLLAAFGERRPIADVDLLGRTMSNGADALAALVRDVLTVRVEDDGVVFDADRLRTEVIREADPYSGVRLTIPAHLARARLPLRVDANMGDPVTPALSRCGTRHSSASRSQFSATRWSRCSPRRSSRWWTEVTRRPGNATLLTSWCSPAATRSALDEWWPPSRRQRHIGNRTYVHSARSSPLWPQNGNATGIGSSNDADWLTRYRATTSRQSAVSLPSPIQS